MNDIRLEVLKKGEKLAIPVPDSFSAGAERTTFSPAAVRKLNSVLILISAQPSSLESTIFAARAKICGAARPVRNRKLLILSDKLEF